MTEGHPGVSRSRLTVTVAPEDDGATLRCSTHSPLPPGGGSTSITLSVTCELGGGALGALGGAGRGGLGEQGWTGRPYREVKGILGGTGETERLGWEAGMGGQSYTGRYWGDWEAELGAPD